MPEFNAPLRDMRFVLHEVFAAPALWARLPALADHVDADTADAILEEAAKVTGQLIAPLNRAGDEEGALWLAGQVTTPAGFKVPRTVVFTLLPKTSTGKVQKYVLRDIAKAL